jgi:prophage antirepressor-like protein
MEPVVQIFSRDLHGRTVAVAGMMVDSVRWFKVTDVCGSVNLDDERSSAILSTLPREATKTAEDLGYCGHTLWEGQVWIREAEMSRLYRASDLSESLEFEDWLRTEVLPYVREGGWSPKQQREELREERRKDLELDRLEIQNCKDAASAQRMMIENEALRGRSTRARSRSRSRP